MDLLKTFGDIPGLMTQLRYFLLGNIYWYEDAIKNLWASLSKIALYFASTLIWMNVKLSGPGVQDFF